MPLLTTAAPSIEFELEPGFDYTLVLANIGSGATVRVSTKAADHPALVDISGVTQPIAADTCFRFTAPAKFLSVAGTDVTDDIAVELNRCPV